MAEATQQSSQDMQASNQRPIPLIRRADLVVADIDYLGVGYQVIKDPVGLKYHRLQVEQYKILDLLDGERSLEQVKDDLKVFFPTLQVTLSDIQQLITDLHKKALVTSKRPGQGAAVIRERKKDKKQKMKQALMSIMYLRLPGWDPEATLRWMYPYTKFLFWKPFVWTTMLFVISAWLMLGANFDEFQSRLPEFQSFFGWPNLMYLWIVLGAAKIIHEFGHGLSCHHYKGECHEMGVMLLVFSPCLYCDVTDSWMMKSKWHRIMIGAAGMYIEVVISALAIYVWWFSKPGMVHYLALNTFFVTTITTVIFNANPLMRFDGYYMMSDYLEIPNLRAKSEKMLREAFSWYCLGIESRPDPFMPETGKLWFVLYAIAAWLYRWVILLSITTFLYTVLKPYDLQSIGIMLCIFSMAGIVFAMFKNVYQILATPRMEPMSKTKIAVSAAIFSGLMYVVLSIPIRWYHHSPFLVEPVNVAYVTAPATGGEVLTPQRYLEIYNRLKSEQEAVFDIDWDVFEREFDQSRFDLMTALPAPSSYASLPEPGQKVYQDEILFIIEDQNASRVRDQIADLLMQWRTQIDIAIEHEEGRENATRDTDIEIYKVKTEMKKLRSSMDELMRLLATRIIRAPKDGTVVAPDRIPEPKREVINRTKLTSWHGTVLDDRNHGCFVEPGAELLKIAPTSQLQAVAYIDQSDREDLPDDAIVELKLDHLPGISYKAPVTLVSGKDEQMAPPQLTTKYGGPLATRPDDQGQESLTRANYQAIVEMHFVHEESKADAMLIRPGMRGQMRFLVDNRTVYQWLRRFVLETFRFNL